MSRAVLILYSQAARDKAMRWIASVPINSRIEFKAPQRTLPQNDKMHAMLTEVAEQLVWHGQKYSADDWKDYMMHALRRARWMPSEDGGMVPIGLRTSDLGVAEMGELIDLIDAFGATHGVVFSTPADQPKEQVGA